MIVYHSRRYVYRFCCMLICACIIHYLMIAYVSFNNPALNPIHIKNKSLDIMLQSISLEEETSKAYAETYSETHEIEKDIEESIPSVIPHIEENTKIEAKSKPHVGIQSVKPKVQYKKEAEARKKEVQKDIQNVIHQEKEATIGKSAEIEPLVLTPMAHRKPEYPKLARKRGHQGRVLLRAYIDEKGSLINVSVEKSSGHSLLDFSALKAVQGWTFSPASCNGISKKGSLLIPISFILKK